MRITGVSCSLLPPEALRPATCVARPARALCAVELHTDERLSGLAIAQEDVRESVHRLVDEVLLGEDPCTVTSLFERMSEAGARRGCAGAVTAISALDVALWDLKAQYHHVPLWKCLGGSRPRVPVHAGSIECDATPAALDAWYAEMARSYGCSSAMLRASSDPHADERSLAFLQTAMGARATLALEAGSSWTAKDAIRHVRALERNFDLFWIEVPGQSWDFLASRRVVDAVRAPLCLGAGIAITQELLPYFCNRSVNVLKLGARRGGITGALREADAAFGFELPVLLEAAAGNLNAQLAGVLPSCMSLEVLDPRPEDGILESDVTVEGGWARVGDRPGHGVRLCRSKEYA